MRIKGINTYKVLRAYSKGISVRYYYLLLITWLVYVKIYSGYIAYIVVLYTFKLFSAQNIAQNNSINGKLN